MENYKNYISEQEFGEGSKQIKRPSFRRLILDKLNGKIANAEGVQKIVGGEMKKVRQALNNLARDGKVERRLFNGIVYYKKV